MKTGILGLLAVGLLAGPITSQAVSFHLILESNTNAAGGSEVFAATFNSYADVLSGTLASAAFSALDISSGFSIHGLAYDGSQYRLLLESNADAAGGSEVFGATFNSFADVLSGTLASAAFSALDISSGFSIHGFAYDGSQYHLLLESNADAAGGSEVFGATFNSYADVLSGTLASAAFSTLDISSGFSIAGFTSDWSSGGSSGGSVPEPGTLALLGLGLAGLGMTRRRKAA